MLNITLEKIKAIIVADLCLVLLHLDMDTFIIHIDILDLEISLTLQKV
jgi:hypothetical protein